MSQLRTFFAGCTTMAAALGAVFFLAGANNSPRIARFDEITVGRINIVEPDGSKRMIISNRSQFPGDFVHGKESPRPDRRDFAGMIFVNDEGTENGGFIQNGSINGKGNADAGLSLTFDRFRQDQTLQLLHAESDGMPMTAVMINDAPNFKNTSISDTKQFGVEAEKLAPEAREAYWDSLKADGKLLNQRVFLGTRSDRTSSLELKDTKGRTRMKLLVAADGRPEIQMLDETGKVVKTVDAARN